MPESPEVKIMTGNIAALALGRTLVSVEVKENFLKRTKEMTTDQLNLPQQIVNVDCKGKFGYLILEDGSAIGISFGMTGNIRVPPTEDILQRRGETEEQYMKHCKIKFTLDGGSIFYFHCTRNFACVHHLSGSELGKKLASIGPSILGEPLTKSQLISRWRRASFNTKTVCELLMEQKLVSGIGNYIKAEVLYRTHYHPLAKVNTLDDDHLWQMYQEARAIAQDAYEAGGASLYTYTGMNGDRTEFKDQLRVYDRAYDPLGNKVERLATPDNRTTHWVPVVQTIGVAPRTLIRPKLRPKPSADRPPEEEQN